MSPEIPLPIHAIQSNIADRASAKQSFCPDFANTKASAKEIPTIKKSGDPEAKKKSRGDCPSKRADFPSSVALPSPALPRSLNSHAPILGDSCSQSSTVLPYSPNPNPNANDHSSASHRIASKQSSSSSSQISISLILHHDFAIPLRSQPL